MSLRDLYALQEHLDKSKGKPVEHLIPWVNAQYYLFCNWINTQGSSLNRMPAPRFQITSTIRDDKGSHGRGHALDIARMDTISPIQKQYVGLFGLYLQKLNKNICHVAISVHNVHIHIDCDLDRKGWNDQEYIDSKKTFQFQSLNKKEIYTHYQFNEHITALADMLYNGKDSTFVVPSSLNGAKEAVASALSTAGLIITSIATLIILSLFRG